MFNKITAFLKGLSYHAALSGPWFTLTSPKKEVENTEDLFTINGTEYRAVPARSYDEPWCECCAFSSGCVIPGRPSCVPHGRKDSRNVIFVEVVR
jgi:hypothetical protein